jgi:hypothetical protein
LSVPHHHQPPLKPTPPMPRKSPRDDDWYWTATSQQNVDPYQMRLWREQEAEEEARRAPLRAKHLMRLLKSDKYSPRTQAREVEKGSSDKVLRGSFLVGAKKGVWEGSQQKSTEKRRQNSSRQAQTPQTPQTPRRYRHVFPTPSPRNPSPKLPLLAPLGDVEEKQPDTQQTYIHPHPPSSSS